MDQLPTDPAILLSFINTRLRDVYKDLDALCDDMHLDRKALEERLAQAGFEYSSSQNKFW